MGNDWQRFAFRRHGQIEEELVDASMRCTTAYFKMLLSLAYMKSVEIGPSVYHEGPLAREHIEEGRLSGGATERLFAKAAKGERRGENEDKTSVDILVVVKSVCEEGGSVHALLVAPALLTREGELHPPEEVRPWIPRDRLSADRESDCAVLVGKMQAFQRFMREKSPSMVSRVETWADYLSYCDELYGYVCDYDRKDLSDDGIVLHEDEVFILVDDAIDPTAPLIEVYSGLLRSKQEPPRLYSAFLDPKRQEMVESGALSCDVAGMKRHRGQMGSRFPLAPSQREAMRYFTRLGEGDALAVSGPPGTGKTTMLQSIVADMLVDHALRGAEPPIIVGVSTNNQAVTNIIDSFGGAGARENPWMQRWLPECDEANENARFPSFATYFPSAKKKEEAIRKGYLISSALKDGVYDQYSKPDYVAKARRFFAQQAGCEASTSLKLIGEQLRRKLGQVNEARERIVQNSAILAQPGIEMQVVEARNKMALLRERVEALQSRAREWLSFERQTFGVGLFAMVARAIRRSREPHYVETYRAVGENLVRSCSSFEEVHRAYAASIAEAEKEYRKAERAAAECERLKKEQDRACEERELDAALLRELGVVSEGQLSGKGGLRELCDIAKVDAWLDTTVRVWEFWAAVHYYECRWLQLCEKGGFEGIIEEDYRYQTTETALKRFYTQLAHITPCFVMTLYQFPKYFKAYVGDGPKKHLYGFVDLLIVDEAGQVDTPIGAAALPFAKQAIVVGDVCQIPPVWKYEPDADREIAESVGVSAALWERMASLGLTGSRKSSFMKASMSATPWRLGEGEGGLFLAEHRRCYDEVISFCNDLLYGGRLIPLRGSCFSSGDAYPLLGDLPAFGILDVPGSVSARFGTSRINRAEAQAIALWLAENFDFIAQRYEALKKDVKRSDLVAVVTPFRAQAVFIRETLQDRCGERISQMITVGTAHTLQGAERRIVLFSLVYGENDGRCFFVEQNPELMNVAVSRAKDAFIVVGSKKKLVSSDRVTGLLGFHAIENQVCDVLGGRGEGVSVGFNEMDEGRGRSDSEDAAALPLEAPASISACLKEWKASGLLPSEWGGLNAKVLNERLASFGLIVKTSDGWEPSSRGIAVGIVALEGEGRNGFYRYCGYGKAAQSFILDNFVELMNA